MILRIFCVCLLLTISYPQGYAQTKDNNQTNTQGTVYSLPQEWQNDTALAIFTIDDCVKYALKNQPAINQSRLDEAIAHSNKGIALSSWLPQVSGSASYQHYFQLPTAFSTVNGTLTPIKSGVYNYSLPQITATQNIFNTDVLFAERIAKLGINSAEQNTLTNKINLVADVNKAFYDILLTQEQILVYMEDTARLTKNKEDAYHRYKSGVADKVDLKQATISLNNAMTQLRTANEQLDAKYAVLKMILGCPPSKPLRVVYDPAILLKELSIDTNATLQISKRPEFKQLLLARSMQIENARYYKMGFLPSLSAYYNYVQEFENNKFDQLFNNAYPYSSWGLQLNIPIFSGLRRTENVHKANLQVQRADYDILNLELTIYAQYKQALASYKSNLYYFHEQAENVTLAKEVYNIVKLQYTEGIKAYLDVIVAETDLQSAQINYLNAVFQTLVSKVNLEKSMGELTAVE